MPSRGVQGTAVPEVPAVIAAAGNRVVRRFIGFFTDNIRNRNTRMAYARAVVRFCHWVEQQELQLHQIDPIVIAFYVDQLCREVATPTVKQHLSAITTLFHWFTIAGIVAVNPATSVRGPKHVRGQIQTLILDRRSARTLLDSIDGTTIAGLRDRALIGVMLFAFGRVGAVVSMNVEDYYRNGRDRWFRLHETEDRFHELPAHHLARRYMNAYLHAADIRNEPGGPLFRSLNRKRQLSDRRIAAGDVLRMTKRRACLTTDGTS